MAPIQFSIEAQDRKREILDHVTGHFGFDLLQSGSIDLVFIQGTRSLGFEFDFPLVKKQVAIPREQTTSDMLAEDAAVLVRLVKMFAYAARQVVPAPVGPDSNNAIAAVTLFSVLEQDINSVLWNVREIFALQARQARQRIVKIMTGLAHDTYCPSHRNWLPK